MEIPNPLIKRSDYNKALAEALNAEAQLAEAHGAQVRERYELRESEALAHECSYRTGYHTAIEMIVKGVLRFNEP